MKCNLSIKIFSLIESSERFEDIGVGEGVDPPSPILKMKKVMTKDYRKKLSKALKGRSFIDLHGVKGAKEHRRKISEALKGNKNGHGCKGQKKPYMIGNTFAKGKPAWNKGLTVATDERVLRNARNVLKSICSHPNKFEARALMHLERLYPKRFSFTGDGSVWINGKSPDALDAKSRTVALFNGIYWHLKRQGLEVSERNKRMVEKKEAKPFLKVGYRVIFIWEDEI